LDAASQRHPDGLLFLSSPLFSAYNKQFVDLTLKHRLPAIAFFSIFPRAGGLMSYGPNLDALYRELGVMAGKILKGTKPADLPAERPSRFELVVNLKTAKILNLNIPNSMLLVADEVIE
jgi:putative tryptophan/tyrosine transport system substrate-binding protein